MSLSVGCFNHPASQREKNGVDLNVTGICPESQSSKGWGMSLLLGIEFNEVGVHRGICFRSS